MPSPWEFDLLRLTTALRIWLLDELTDEDLTFALPGNPPLGELCRGMGSVEAAYVAAFRTRRMDWTAATPEPGIERSVERLRAWFADLDRELQEALRAIPDDEFQSGSVDRGEGFQMPMGATFHTYREAILIFCAKADVYLRAIGKDRGEQWVDWIG